jgi:hypothetical protein
MPTFTPSDVHKALHVIDSSDAATKLDELRGQDGSRGRPSPMPTRVFLLGALLSTWRGTGLVMTDIHKCLTQDLSRDLQVELGIRRSITGKPRITVGIVEDRAKSIFTAVAYDGERRTRDTELLERVERLLWPILDAMLDATLIPTTSRYRSIDGTGIWAWGRAPSKPKVSDLAREVRAQIEAGNHDEAQYMANLVLGMAKTEKAKQKVRAIFDGLDLPELNPDDEEVDAEHAGTDEPTEQEAPLVIDLRTDGRSERGHDPDARSAGKTAKDGRTEWLFGYFAHATCRVAEPGNAYTSEPVLIERVRVTPGARGLIPASQALISTAPAWDGRPRVILGDRAYSNLREENWYRHLVNHGWEQIVDMREDDQTWTTVKSGARVTAGQMFCPATPDHLMSITRAITADVNEFETRIAERNQYAAQVNARTEHGLQVRCPALAGRCRCPLRPETLVASPELVLIDNHPEADTAPKICTQDTVLVRWDEPTAKARLWQRPVWGTPQHRTAYNRRTSIEQTFARLKDPQGTNVSRGFIRVTGLVAYAFGVGLASIATNLRELETWGARYDDGRDPDNPLLAPRDEYIVLHLSEIEAQVVELALAEHREQLAAA